MGRIIFIYEEKTSSERLICPWPYQNSQELKRAGSNRFNIHPDSERLVNRWQGKRHAQHYQNTSERWDHCGKTKEVRQAHPEWCWSLKCGDVTAVNQDYWMTRFHWRVTQSGCASSASVPRCCRPETDQSRYHWTGREIRKEVTDKLESLTRQYIIDTGHK